jgi:hypothetical protein
MDHIVAKLKANKSGCYESELVLEHDPALIRHALGILVGRNAVTVFYDDSRAGSDRKLYRLKG